MTVFLRREEFEGAKNVLSGKVKQGVVSKIAELCSREAIYILYKHSFTLALTYQHIEEHVQVIVR